MDRTILHCDNDAFYSTTEEMLNPKLRGKAHAVAGSVEDRNGIILAKSYVAKKLGVKTGEAIWQAKQKCPDLITMPPNYEMYLKYSKLANRIYSEYTDLIQPLGMDEAWLDLTKGHEVCHHILGRMYPGEYGVYHRVHCLYRKKGESRQEITDWGEWQADALTSAILMPKEALEEAMFMFSLGEKMKVLSRKYSQNKYEQFCEMADFLGVSRTSLSFRMEKLGLLERNYLIQEAQARKGAAS